MSYAVDGVRDLVLLLLGGKALALILDQLRLLGRALVFFALGIGVSKSTFRRDSKTRWVG